MGYLQIIYIIAIVMYAVWLITALLMPCAIKKVFLSRLYITFRYICRWCTCEMLYQLAQSISELTGSFNSIAQTWRSSDYRIPVSHF